MLCPDAFVVFRLQCFVSIGLVIVHTLYIYVYKERERKFKNVCIFSSSGCQLVRRFVILAGDSLESLMNLETVLIQNRFFSSQVSEQKEALFKRCSSGNPLRTPLSF